MTRLVSGREKTVAPGDVSDSRYEFLHPGQAEPNLGQAAFEGYVLSYNSTMPGEREWVPSSAGAQGAQGVQGLKFSTYIGATAPPGATAGDIWFDSETGIRYVYYTDPDSSQWVQESAPGALGPQGTSAPGSQGAQGSFGSQGLIGVSVQGIAGSASSQGAQGSFGSQGLIGVSVQGIAGSASSQGAQGTLGVQGTNGISVQGIAGSASSQGAQGTLGVQGTNGISVQGTNGLSIQGAAGSASSQGAQGSFGSQGTSGISVQGADGGGSPGPEYLHHVTSGYTSSARVLVSSSTPAAGNTQGDIWFDISATEGYTQSLASTGWTKLPNGLIFQWGYTAVTSATNTTITFPTTFTTACFSFTFSDYNTSPNNTNDRSSHSVVSTPSTTSATVFVSNGTSVSHIYWMAIGY